MCVWGMGREKIVLPKPCMALFNLFLILPKPCMALFYLFLIFVSEEAKDVNHIDPICLVAFFNLYVPFLWRSLHTMQKKLRLVHTYLKLKSPFFFALRAKQTRIIHTLYFEH